jgi:hypothetical protein
MFNDWSWVSDRADSQERRFERFAESVVRPVVIEIGAGTGIPSLRNLSRRRGWPVVRINLDEAGVKEGDGVGLRVGALAGIRVLVEDLVAMCHILKRNLKVSQPNVGGFRTSIRQSSLRREGGAEMIERD